MRIEVDCSWRVGDKRKTGKVSISFLAEPAELFPSDPKDGALLVELADKYLLEGPATLELLKDLYLKYTDKVFPCMVYYFALKDFGYVTEAEDLFVELSKNFSEEPLYKCAEAQLHFEKNDLEAIPPLFLGQESLKGSFPNREVFFFQEAIFYHKVWETWFNLSGDLLQAEKHFKFQILITDTLSTFQKMNANYVAEEDPI